LVDVSDGSPGEVTAPAVHKVGARQTWRESPTPVKVLIVGTFVHRLGGFIQFFLVLYLVSRGYSVTQAGTALGAYGAGMIAGVLVGGWLTDRIGPRRTIVGSLAVTAILLPTVLYLTNIVAIVAVVTLIGAIGQAYRPASTSALSQLTPQSRHVMVFAMVRLATNLGTGIGPLLGAALAAVTYSLLFWVEGAAVLGFAVLASGALRAMPEPTGQHAPPGPDRSRRSARYLDVLHDRRYLLFLVVLGITSMIYIQYVATLPLAVRAAGLSTWEYGMLIGLNGIAIVVCELAVASRVQHWPARRAVALGVLLTAVGMAGYGVRPELWIFVLATLVWTMGETVGYPTLFFAYPSQAGPAHLRGRYLGASNAVYGIGCALGPPLGVAIWTAAGTDLWWYCGAAGLITAVLAWWTVAPRLEATAAPGLEPAAAPGLESKETPDA
jgi:predicted MFS family arabinose efflux permease